jgi:hypothetical protein
MVVEITTFIKALENLTTIVLKPEPVIDLV